MLWREVVLRRAVIARYRLRATGQDVFLRHRSADLGGVTEIVVNRIYASPEVTRILSEISGPPRVVDLGANIGLFSLRMQAERPDATIIAVEPDPSNARMLKATAVANDAPWTVIEACAATEDGTVLFEAGRFLESSTGDAGQPTPAVDVLPFLIDADVVKIDIEGAELALLEDPRFRQTRARIVLLEYHPPNPVGRIVAALEGAGFAVDPFHERSPGLAEITAWK